MRKLTPKQAKFAAGYVEVGNACEAYRQAYCCARMSKRSIEVESGKLLKRPAVAMRIAELTQKAAKKRAVTAERIINRLADFAFPDDDGHVVKDRDAIRALELLGKRFALWIDRHQVEGPQWEEIFDLLPSDLQRRIVEELEKVDVPSASHGSQ
jgi:phage terminase small subunit